MWNFEECKDKLEMQYATHNWDTESGLPYDTLEENARKISEDKSISSARVKADMICYLLKNAQIEINPDEIFADKLNCNSIIWKHHLCKNRQSVLDNECREVWEKVSSLKNISCVIPEMDFGHIYPDWNFIIENGIPGIILRLENLKTTKNAEFYDCYIDVYRAISDCMKKMAVIAQKNGTVKSDFTAQNLIALTKSAPKTLAQAMQLTLIIYSVQTEIEMTTVRSLGGLDRLYYPLYKADLESGRFTEKQLRELVRDFFWKISAKKTTANMPFYICDKKPDGSDATNEFTKLMLEEYRKLDIYDPKIHVMYHDGIDQNVVELILDMIREGKNSFVFMNTDVMEKALLGIGIEPEDAKRLIVYGCYEGAAEGTEVPATCGGRINISKAVELALYNGMDVISENQAGITNGESFLNFKEFYSAVKCQIKYMLDICMETITSFEHYYRKICPAPVISASFTSCAEKGMDIFSGGAKYNNTSVVCAGFATLVDSLIVMKKVVFEEKKVTFDEIKQILKENWKGNEKLRLYCRENYSKFGNSHPEADELVVDVYNFCAKSINNRKNGRGGVFRFGAFSVDWRYYMGKSMCATPDGRLSGEPFSKNLCSALGQDKEGATAYLNSLLKLDASCCPDGSVADVTLHSSAVSGDSGMTALKGLLTTYMSRGGYSVHFNALNPEELKKAQRNPEKYKNLQIRVCGWNARFVSLSEYEQNEFIKMLEI